jgi:large subunit ribosomal protein L4
MAQTQHNAPQLAQAVTPAELWAQLPERSTISPSGFALCVRTLLQNWRQGTVACKTRGEVAFSNKKPWKQKGTGRARVSSLRSPLWRKGGVIFGPQPRVRKLKASREIKKSVLLALLWERLDKASVIELNWEVEGKIPKTTQAHKALESAGLHDKRVIFFVAPHDVLTQASLANIPSVSLLLFDQPNAYNVAREDYWVFLKKDRDAFKNMVNTWI